MQPLTSEVKQAFLENGYVILADHLEPDELAQLRGICDDLLAEPPDDDEGGKGHDIGRGHDRRFLRHRHKDKPELASFVLGPGMRDLVSPVVGARPHLFNEQFVVKGPRTGASFAWHQDSGYVGFGHKPYLTVWIALDDTTVENGAVYILPRDLRRDMSVSEHRRDEAGKELVGYDGDEPGVPAIVSAGSIVLFSSVTLHRSSANTTARPRRAFVAQYSGVPIIDPITQRPKTFATPL
ncbi:MAG: phytanoyl-CoA dioxygenase family protein [Geminicoccaceae bacterium]